MQVAPVARVAVGGLQNGNRHNIPYRLTVPIANRDSAAVGHLLSRLSLTQCPSAHLLNRLSLTGWSWHISGGTCRWPGADAHYLGSQRA